MKSLLMIMRAGILQNTKRLRTYSVPQEKEILHVDAKIFQKEALLALIRFKGAFQKMAEGNKSKQIKIELTDLSKLQVRDQEGSMVLQADSELSILFYNSPLSGTYKYYFDAEQKRFYSNKDGHLLDENLSREVQRYFGDVLEL